MVIVLWLGSFSAFLFPGLIAYGQELQTIRDAEVELSKDFQALKNQRDDSSRSRINNHILDRFSTILLLPSSINYPFDSLKSVDRITSGDNMFTIYHWNIQSRNGHHTYYGFLQITRENKPKLYPLIDKSDSISGADSMILDTGHWFGALYYRIIIGNTALGKTMYTLLGWSGENADITAKVIDVLTFDNSGEPHFGLPVFIAQTGGGKTRIIFRFSSHSTMVLKYEDQVVKTTKKWNPRKREFEEAIKWNKIIVFDRLVPLDPIMEGQYQFYVPAGDVNDGYYMENGLWKFIEGIESRNTPH